MANPYEFDDSDMERRELSVPRRIFIGRSLSDQYDLPEDLSDYLNSAEKRNTRRHLFLGKRFFGNDGKRNGIHRIFIGKRAGDIKRIFIG